MICKNCNAKMPDDCIYCANCGAKLEEEKDSRQELTVSSKSQRNSKKAIAVVLSISAIIIMLLIAIIIILTGKSKNVDSSTTVQTTSKQMQSATVETSSKNETGTENNPDTEYDGDYAYESDYLYPAVDEYISMLNNSDIVKAGTNYEIDYHNDNPNSFKAELKVDDITIQTVEAGSPISEDDDNFGRITDVMVVTKNFAQTSNQNQGSTVLFGAAMTPIMPVLAPDKPISYAVTILDNHTKEYWTKSNLHIYTGTQNSIPWIIIYKSDGTIATACGELSVEYLTTSFQ